VGWLLLAALLIMWAAFLFPTWRRTPGDTVKDFERNMDLLAETEGGEGRWIVTPRKGMTFIGPKARAQARARERRRRVLIVLVESVALTALIGLVPPLRMMWYATAALLVALGAYVWLLVSITGRRGADRVPAQVAAPARPKPARHRFAADASARTARASYNGLSTFGTDDRAPIVVKPASAVGASSV
jgi:hypothetical protein